MKVLVTGALGFVGRNLCAVLSRISDVELTRYDLGSSLAELDSALSEADIIYHLAGVNRPRDVAEFETGNAGFTAEICDSLRALGRNPKIVLSSSIQADLENPYGASKRLAEEMLTQFCEATGASCVIYRLNNLFGKWCRPNYNSVTATFCHNIARDLPIQISDPQNKVALTYIDDVVAAFLSEMDDLTGAGCRRAAELAGRTVTLGELAGAIQSFHDHRQSLIVPNFSDPFMGALYATYLSYLEEGNFGYCLDIKADNRGSLAEFIKSPFIGQVFASRTHPGITRGNHYHHTKVEKFLVLQGEAVIRFRGIDDCEIVEYPVHGEEYRVVDIPPGYTHSIENVGDGDMVTLIWSDQIFNPDRPDTMFEPVIREPEEVEAR